MAAELDLGPPEAIVTANILKEQPTADEFLLMKKLNATEVPMQYPKRPPPVRKECICAPTSHRGSFRCRHHRASRDLKLALDHQCGDADSERRKPLTLSKKAVMNTGNSGSGGLAKVSRFAPRALLGGQCDVGDVGLFL